MFGTNTIPTRRRSFIARAACAGRPLLYLERGLWLAGALSLGIFLVLQIQQRAGAAEALRRFYAEQSGAGMEAAFGDAFARSIESADKSYWSETRIAAFDNSAANATGDALAVLRIPRLSLEAPVFVGALEDELDRGPGWIRGTAPVGAVGNVGIAGHRDGYFRALKDIEAGDVIEVLGRNSTTRYRVSDIWIVGPDAVHVLDPTDQPSVTLVTCYPFYFAGHAPKRFIVRAVQEIL